MADLREFVDWIIDHNGAWTKNQRPILEKKLAQALAAEPTESLDARAIVETLGFDPTNHHNAAKCPYCSQPSQALRSEQEKVCPVCGLIWAEHAMTACSFRP